MHGEVHDAGTLVEVEHLAPGGAAVRALEDAALLVRTERIAERGDPDGVGIIGMNDDAADLAGIRQADEAPCPALVGRAIGADSRRHVAADAGRPGAGVDHVGIRRRDGNRSDAACLDLAVRQVLPRGPRIDRAPYAAARCSHVERMRPAGHAGVRRRAAAAVGADHAIPHPVEVRRVDAVGDFLSPSDIRRRAADSDENHRGDDADYDANCKPLHGVPPRRLATAALSRSRGTRPVAGSRREDTRLGVPVVQLLASCSDFPEALRPSSGMATRPNTSGR